MPDQRGLDDSAAYLAASGSTDAWSAATFSQPGTQRLLGVESIEPPWRVADALRLAPGTQVVVRRRLMLLDDKPVEIAESYYPAGIAVDTPLAGTRKIKGGAPRALADLGYVAAYADEEVELEATPTAEEATLLQLAAGQLVARMFRTAYAADGTPFEVAAGAMLRAGRTLHHRIVIDQES